jgi:toxin-antitoxin system PIN domain toxin
VIAVDTNVLVYANRAELPLHDVARVRLAALAEGPAPWGLPVVAAWGFVRIVTQPIFDPPTPLAQAVDFVDRVLASPSVRVLNPGPRHWELLRSVLDDAQARGGLVTDAVIVALCREYGVDTILSNDRDFHRFTGVTVQALNG